MGKNIFLTNHLNKSIKRKNNSFHSELKILTGLNKITMKTSRCEDFMHPNFQKCDVRY